MNNDSQQVVAIRERYKASLGDKANMVARHAAAIAASDNREVYASLHDELHKLAGSAGMYGYDEIAKLCRELMSELKAEQFVSVEARLDELQNLLTSHS